MSATLDPFLALPGLQPYHAVLQIIGTIGCLVYVGGYLLVQSGRICGNGVSYAASKIIAAFCVLASLTTSFNLASFLIQISFIAISVYGIWYRVSGRIRAQRARASAARLRAAAFPIAQHGMLADLPARDPASAPLRASPLCRPWGAGRAQGHPMAAGDPEPLFPAAIPSARGRA